MVRNLRVWILVIGLIVLAAFSSTAQVKNRTVEVGKVKASQPVTLINIELKSGPALGSTTVLSDRNWLTEIRFNVKNISTKTITSIEIHLIVAPQNKMKNQFALPLRFGLPPGISTCHEFTGIGNSTRKLGPNESAQISVVADNVERMFEALRKFDVVDIDRVTLEVVFVTFDDDTAWSDGLRMRRSPTDDLKWEVDDPPGALKADPVNSLFGPALLTGSVGAINFQEVYISLSRFFLAEIRSPGKHRIQAKVDAGGRREQTCLAVVTALLIVQALTVPCERIY